MKNINRYNIVKWFRMITGTSILHVNQGIGKVYSKEKVLGYYNDLTEKVLKDPRFDFIEIPKSKTESGEEVIFPIAVFQYGLGAYDLYLIEKKEIYLDKFKCMVTWALENQEINGSWNNFFYIYPSNPYSAMAQGEGLSLLIRAYVEFDDEIYLVAAKKALDFMLLPIENGGTTKYDGENVFLKEFTHKPTVLNGWIFAIFGLYDYLKVCKDKKAQEVLESTLATIENELINFDNGYWSMYNKKNIITSNFYHDLHIAQMSVLYDLFEIKAYKEYADKWMKYKRIKVNKYRAFIVKVFQKIFERDQ